MPSNSNRTRKAAGRRKTPPAGAASGRRRTRAAARPPSIIDGYIALTKFLSRVAGIAAAFLIGLGVLVICDMVVERYIFNLTTIWQIDVVTYSIVAATFVGSAYVLMTRGHVNVDVLPLPIGPRARYWLALLTGILGFGFCAVLLVLGTQYWHEAWAENWHSNTVWRAPLWVPYASMPIGLGLLVLQYIAELLSVLTGRSPPFGLGEDRVHA